MERIIPSHFDSYFVEDAFRPTDDPQLRMGRVRAFYKYSNRNGSYITDEYAQKLAVSAYMKPIFGYYSHDNGDFLGHEGPEKVKAYGFVLPNSLSWEDHLDEDGITRTYATYDVLIWAEYWDEAKTILHKAQSMEIDSNTVQGEWRMIGGGTFEEFVFTEGVMAGLCILGDMKVPCFEGAAFFSLDDDSYAKFTLAIKNYYSNGGKDAMNVKVAGLEHEQFNAIWNALNPNFNEEGAYSMNLIPCEITEEHVFALSCEQAGKVVKYSYSFEEEEIKVELVEEINYKEVAAGFEAAAAEASNQLAEAQTSHETLLEQFNTLTAEKETLTAEFETLRNELSTLQAEFEKQLELFNQQAATLAEKDATIAQQSETITDYENKEKDSLLAKFSTSMPADILQSIADRKNSLTIKELNTELALEYTKFSMAKEHKEEIRIPQDTTPTIAPEKAALFKILDNYKK